MPTNGRHLPVPCRPTVGIYLCHTDQRSASTG